MAISDEGSEYQRARTAINRHLHRHHGGSQGSGNLPDRIKQHHDLHLLLEEKGIAATHAHEPYRRGETWEELAVRFLREGQERHGSDS